MQELLFKTDGSTIPSLPRSRMTSTARQGDKWLGRAGPGDMLALRVTDGPVFAKAVCLGVEQTTYSGVIARALENHANQMSDIAPDESTARHNLRSALEAAYGPDQAPGDTYCIVHFIIINE